MPDPSLSQVHGRPRTYPPSLWHSLKPMFEQDPNAPAVIALHQKSDHLSQLLHYESQSNGHDSLSNGQNNGKHDSKYLSWSFRELDLASTRVAAAMYRRGIEPAATLISFIPNGVEWCVLNVTSMKAKLNFTALDLGALGESRAGELAYFLDLLRPEIVVVADAKSAAVIDKATESRPLKLRLVTEAVEAPKGWLSLSDLAAESDAASRAAVVEEALKDDHERTCVTMFTSGTSSGKPKGCPRSVLSMLHQLDHTERAWKKTPSRRLVDTANFRAIAQGFALSTWQEGGAFVMSGRTASPEGAIRAIEKVQVTDLIFIPAMIRMIHSHPDYAPEKVASVRTCATGGDVVTKAVIQLIQQTFPNAIGLNAHGMTETAKFFIALDYLDENGKGEPRYRDNVATCGRVAPGVKLKVVNDGKVVPRGRPGELEVGSAISVRQYLQNVNPQTFYTDADGGWLRTGDTAVIDEDGYIFIVGRSKDVIKRAGVPVVPSALESALSPFANAEVVIIGIDHPILDAEPWAVLDNLKSRTEVDIKQHVLDKFGNDYALGGVVSLAELNMTSMPLNTTGKIQKPELKNALMAHLDARRQNGSH